MCTGRRQKNTNSGSEAATVAAMPTSTPGTSHPAASPATPSGCRLAARQRSTPTASSSAPLIRGFVGDVPFVTALVELDEGPIMPTNIVIENPTPENLVIGMPLEVVFEDVTDEISLPKFKPA